MAENLIGALHKEMNRVRELIKEYEDIPNGKLGAALMKLDISKAEKSIEEGDVVQMLIAYNSLKETTG